jgi:[CysO sulfur-carrier protein]-S-L-cysteine hydrolase
LSTPFLLQVSRRFVDEMVAHAQAERPNECCGFLAGTVEQLADADVCTTLPLARVIRRYALVNAAASPITYFADPSDLFSAHKDMRRCGLELLAIYHSHPTSDPVPSRRDRDQNQYPGVMHFIISLKTNEPAIRSWWLTPEAHHEAAWRIDDHEPDSLA